MLKWLFLLAAGLYGAMLIGGEDRGQQRAGLRDQPPEAAPAVVAALPAAQQQAASPAAASSPLPAEVVAATLASVPAQPIRILPAPPRAPAVAAPAPAPAGEPAAGGDAAATLPPNTELRWVAVDRANVRKSPSRQATVTGRVESGEALLVLWVEDSGWARVRVEGDGIDGFVHESLLTDTDPTQ
ncbi:MAG: hypothetical protein RIR62_1660 [Pseudomonadota bacterium]|jgi:uncharacterized protein YgiM (DUF1202 family)